MSEQRSVSPVHITQSRSLGPDVYGSGSEQKNVSTVGLRKEK